jgi:hypothetical protein
MSEYLGALFRRRPNQGWFTAGRYDVTTTDIICALAVLSMFVYGASLSAFEKLIFSAPAVRDLELWRIVTWPIATEPSIWGLLGIVFFWLFGQQLEGLFERNKFLIWILATTVTPAVVLTVLGSLDESLDPTSFEFGLSTLFLGGIWVYAATYPGVRWFEIVPLWAIAAAFTLLNLLQYTGSRATGAVLFLLISIAAALVTGRSLGLASGWPIPHLPLSHAGSGSPMLKRRSRGKRSKRAKDSGKGVVEGPWTRGTAPPPPPPRSTPSLADQAELDALLDKIGAQGMESLTSGEKKRLNELSKRLRNN